MDSGVKLRNDGRKNKYTLQLPLVVIPNACEESRFLALLEMTRLRELKHLKGMNSGITYPAMQWKDKFRNDGGGEYDYLKFRCLQALFLCRLFEDAFQ